MRHFAISAANFSISTLILQKQHRFKHEKTIFSSAQTQNQIITIFHTFEMQKKTPVMTSRKYH